jgi:cell division protease FtsH
LGVTMQIPEEDTYNYSKEYMEASVAILLAGKVAEEIFLGTCTTGASNDLERVTERARKMVCEWGMSEVLGPLTFGKKEEQIFLGREIAQHHDYSEDTAIQIDREVKKVVLKGYAKAKTILGGQREELIRLAEALLEYETLDSGQIVAALKGEEIQRDLGPETPDQPEPKQEEKGKKEEKEQAMPPLVNPDDSPAPA